MYVVCSDISSEYCYIFSFTALNEQFFQSYFYYRSQRFVLVFSQPGKVIFYVMNSVTFVDIFSYYYHPLCYKDSSWNFLSQGKSDHLINKYRFKSEPMERTRLSAGPMSTGLSR